MAYKITFSKKAFSELEEAYLWYRESSPSVASKFYAGVLARIDEMISHPHAFGSVRKRPRYRRAKVKRFPYLIVFALMIATNGFSFFRFGMSAANPKTCLKD